MKTLGPTQDRVLTYLRNGVVPVTTAEIAEDIGFSRNQVKHAVARLFAEGHILRTKDKPSKWFANKPSMTTPPASHAQPLHGTMPQA